MSVGQMRPQASQLLELHVFYVPEGVWDFKLNTVPVAVTSKFISAGFIRLCDVSFIPHSSPQKPCFCFRGDAAVNSALLLKEHPKGNHSDVTILLASGSKVSPHITLRVLREKLGEYLGGVAVGDKFRFLKCIGKKLAVVKAKQETELELKSFAPPYALYPELYLLPGVEYFEDVYPLSSSAQQKHHFNAETSRFGHGLGLSSVPQQKTEKGDHFLGSIQSGHQLENQEVHSPEEWHEKEPIPALHTKHKQGHNNRMQENQRQFKEKDQNRSNGYFFTPSLSNPANPVSGKSDTVLQTSQQNHLSQDQNEQNTPKRNDKAKGTAVTLHVDCSDEHGQNNQILEHHIKYQKEQTNLESSDHQRDTKLRRERIQNAGILKIMEDQTTDHVCKKQSLEQYRASKSLTEYGEKLENQANEKKQDHLTCQKEYSLPPSPPFLALPVNTAQIPAVQAAKNKMVEQLQQIKKERRHMEKTREELIKTAKGLLEQNKLRRYHVREEWKKKYFETKKATASLEDTLTKLRQNLELFHQKLLLQLEARGGPNRPNNMTNSKNYTIIRITTVQHELDQLRRKLDDTKMKLITEIKMRKQAASELRALRADLMQKIHSSFILQSRKSGI